MLPPLDFRVEVDERPVKLAGGRTSDGRLAGPRQTDKDDVRLRHWRDRGGRGAETAEGSEDAENFRWSTANLLQIPLEVPFQLAQ